MARPAPSQGPVDKTPLVGDLAYRHPGLSVICKRQCGPPCRRALGIMTISAITENFALLDDWDDRYRYVIELGRTLGPLPEAARIEANKVQGCASQVWLRTDIDRDGPDAPILRFAGDSDAHIVRGLIAILFAI